MLNLNAPQTYNYVSPETAFSFDGFSRVNIIAEIGIALSLSISLFALQEQAKELKKLKAIVFAKLAEVKQQRGKRRASQTYDVSEKLLPSQEMERVDQQGKEESIPLDVQLRSCGNSSKLQMVNSSAAQELADSNGVQILRNSKKVPRSTAITEVKQSIEAQKQRRVIQTSKKIRKERFIQTAQIACVLSAEDRRAKLQSLLQRRVKTWNPPKEDRYIKNREFRMLLRPV